jgi:methylmalonyl-CoA mutase N-terminal domain/subunit
MGGMFKAIENGFIQREIQESAYKYQKQIESRDRIIVGLNEYVPERKVVRFRLHHPPRKNERAQLEKLRQLRLSRSSGDVEKSLAAVERAARAGKNLLPFLIAAVKAEATLGEVSDVLRKVFGTYREVEVI